MSAPLVVTGGAVLFAFIASAVAVRAAGIHIRNNQDKFIEDLQEQSRWILRAAVLNFFASAFLILAFALDAIDS